MILEPDELHQLLQVEEEYIRHLKDRWKSFGLTEKAEFYLRMGKRTELLGDLQSEKEQAMTRPMPEVNPVPR